jgi:hypothetical protein
LAISATAILLAEACLFDDEKDKAAQKAAERTQKHAADGQLQPATNKCSHTTTGTIQSNTTIEASKDADNDKIDKEMDDYINAESQPCKCHRQVCNDHFGNNDLGMIILSPFVLIVSHPLNGRSFIHALLRTLCTTTCRRLLQYL